jgi:hypothetical protein
MCNPSQWITTGQQGYILQNIYNILDEGGDNNTGNTNTVITQMAAVATTGSMLGNTYANTTTLTIPAKVTAAVNQLLAN